jgi:hypothetical protein
MYPEQSVMRGGNRENRLGFAKATENLLEALQEAGHGARTDGNKTADLHIPASQFSGDNPVALFGGGVFYPEQILRQQLTEAPMDFLDTFGSTCARAIQAAFVDPLLNRDMRFGFVLQIALVRVGTVVILERPLDIHRMRIVTFNKVGIVTIHGTHERGERREQTRREAATKTCGLLREVKSKIRERRAVA